MADVSIDREGRRTVWLYVPFSFNGIRVESITFEPVTLDHSIRWQEGRFKAALDLMAELSGSQQLLLRMARFPDAARLHEEFLHHLPSVIRDDIISGSLPPARAEVDAPVADEAAPVQTSAWEDADASSPSPGFDLDGGIV